jgi:hypothetical protein
MSYEKVIYGNARSLTGQKVIIDLGVNGMIEYTFPEGQREAQWELYCKFLKITFEEVSKEEILANWEI